MTCPTTPRPSPATMGPRRTPPKPTTPAPAAAPSLPPAADTQPARTPAESIAPGQLKGDENLRSLFPRALRMSRMHPEARLVALTLLGYAHYKSGLVNSRNRPNIEQLAEDTGLTTGQVQVQLHVLTQRGWLYTRLLTRGSYNGQPGLFLAIPSFLLEPARAERAAYAAERAQYIAHATGGDQ
ncbi:hypothetical protein PV569_13160 [Streptomyces scabiei]|uniref:hypothetical protein n=1 Tax=Streptomyces scabiei TaxID=1930 RepID=UPI0029B44E7A|nr:hypothetical protein [Streptomyces scabiei]MDX3294656.1 hypothetical protein [Streptomyces scabiei]